MKKNCMCVYLGLSISLGIRVLRLGIEEIVVQEEKDEAEYSRYEELSCDKFDYSMSLPLPLGIRFLEVFTVILPSENFKGNI